MTLGEAEEFYQETPPRGEFVLIVEGAQEAAEQPCTMEDAVSLVLEQKAAGLSTKDAVRRIAEQTGLARNLLYDAVLHAEKSPPLQKHRPLRKAAGGAVLFGCFRYFVRKRWSITTTSARVALLFGFRLRPEPLT